MEKLNKVNLYKIPFIAKYDTHLQEVLKGSIVAFIIKCIGACLSFLYNLFLARTFGAEDTGIYFIALNVITVGTVLGQMGMENALLRFVAASSSVNNWASVKGAYKKGIIIAMISSALITLFLLLSASWIANVIFSKPDLATPLRWMTISIVPIVLTVLHAEVLRGLKRIRDSIFLQGIFIPLLSILGLYFIGNAYSINGAIWVYCTSFGFAALIGYILWQRATPQLKKVKADFDTRKLFSSSMPLLWVAVLYMVIGSSSTFILGIWGSKADVGSFGMALRTASLINFILIAVNTISAPKFAELYEINDMKSLNATARNSTKLMTIISAPILLFFIFFSHWIMKLFGSDFSEGSILLIILSIGQFINVATGSVGYLLIMTGHEHLYRKNVAVTAVLSIGLNIILIPIWGALGAAIATAICISITNLISVYLVYSKLNILTIPINLKKVNI